MNTSERVRVRVRVRVRAKVRMRTRARVRTGARVRSSPRGMVRPAQGRRRVKKGVGGRGVDGVGVGW